MASDNTAKTNLIEQILNSVFFKNANSKASNISSNPTAIIAVVKRALAKISHLGAGGVFSELTKKVTLVGKLAKSYANGSYRDISTKNILIVIASLIYFISPIDLIPDFIPLLGFADDITLLTFVIGSLGEEIEKFELWEINDKLNNP